MFNPSEFLMKTIKGMIGNYPDFQVREYAWKWYGKWLTDENLAEIDTLIEAQYIVTEPPVLEEPSEETTDEVIGDVPTEEPTETESETILDDGEGTETENTTDETLENTYFDETTVE